MSNSNSPKFLKGALIQLADGAMIGGAPNIIVFQYNPESLTRSLRPYNVPDPPSDTAGSSGGGSEAVSSTSEDAQPYDPTETFTLQLLFDAADLLEKPEENGVAVATGVADRVAAVELLLYPGLSALGTGLLGSAGGAVGAGAESTANLAGIAEPVPRTAVPTLLFVWGPGRIVPVRLESFSVEELQYNTLLYPHRAKVSVGLRVITSARLRAIRPQKEAYALAAFAYDYTLGQKQLLALSNLIKTFDSILLGGRLPI